MAPRRNPPQPTHAWFFAALIVFLPLNGSAQKSKSLDAAPPSAVGNPAAPAGASPGAAAITPVNLSVPPANSAPQTAAMAPASAATPAGAVVSGPMPATPAAAASPKKTSSPRTHKTRGA